jgi:phosphohistidine phosphatase
VRLLLLRHAIAPQRDPERWPDDRLRPLTPEGRRKMERGAKGIAALEVRPDLVLTSPLIRASETAKIAAEAFKPRPDVQVLKPLAPGGGSGGVLAGLAGLPPSSTVMLVGHEPDLSQLVGALVVEPRGDLGIEFKKGGLAWIEFEGAPRARAGRLLMLLPPRVLRGLGR